MEKYKLMFVIIEIVIYFNLNEENRHVDKSDDASS